MCAEPISLHEQLTAEPIRELQRLLRDARLIHLQRPEAADKHIRGRAVAAVRNLGYCYLFGSGHVEFPPRVPLPAVRVAVEEAARLYGRWIDRAVRLGEEWESEEFIEWTETVTRQRLEDRMEGEAIYVGISESLFAARRAGELSSDEVDTLLAPLQELLDQWDAVLLDQGDLLSVAVDEPILANWREGLTEPYRDPPLWWLSGMLEEIARETQEQVEADLCSFTSPTKTRSGAGRATAFPARLVTLQLAAAPKTEHVLLRWNSPDGRYYGIGSLPYPPSSGAQVRLALFRAADGQPATELSGQRVDVARVIVKLDQQGQCELAVDELRKTVELGIPLELRVGPEQELWVPDDDSLQRVQRLINDYDQPMESEEE